MKVRTIHLIFIIAVIAATHLLALRFGLYQGKVWIDMPLHFLGGMLVGLIWLWAAISPFLKERLGSPSKFFISFSVVGAALAGSFLWEIFEFGIWQFFPALAEPLRLYSFTVSDLLSDMTFGVLGGVIMALIFNLRHA